MYKTLSLFVLLFTSIVFLLCFPASAENAAELSVEQVTEIAWQYMAENSGLTSEEMADFHCKMRELGNEWNGTRYWMIVFVSDLTGSEFAVQVDYKMGGVHELDRAGYAEEYRRYREILELRAIADEAKVIWEQERGPYFFWPYQDKAAFYQEYPGADPCYLPTSDNMSEAEAVQLTNDAIKQALLGDEAYISNYRLDTCFREAFGWGDVPNPTWLITYRNPEPSYSIRHMAIVNAESGEIVLSAYQNEKGELVTTNEYRDEMYYNPDGGIYFHHDADCYTVAERYRPLIAYARGDIIHNDTLWSLLPCQWCVYLHQGDWGSDWTRG